jgi:hypothetical protein
VRESAAAPAADPQRAAVGALRRALALPLALLQPHSLARCLWGK